MAYVEKYNLSFTDYFGNEIDIYIDEDGHVGASTSFIGTGDPCIMSMNGQDNGIYSRIKSSICTLNIHCTSVTQYSELLTSNNRKHRVRVYKSTNLYFRGYIEQELCTRNLLNYNVITIKAIDGIGYLKSIEFKDGADFYTGKKSLYSCIVDCLNHIDTVSVIVDACDIWADGEDQDLSPLTQQYLDTRLLNDGSTAWTCYKVLDEILKLKICKLYMAYGVWYIIPADLNDTGTTPIKIMDSNGAITSTSTMSISTELTDATGDPLNCPINRSARIDKLPAYSKLTLVQDFAFENDLFQPESVDDFSEADYFNKISITYGTPDLQINELKDLSSEGDQAVTWYLGAEISADSRFKIKVSIKDCYRIKLRLKITWIKEGSILQLNENGEWLYSNQYFAEITEAGDISITTEQGFYYGGDAALKLTFQVLANETYLEGLPGRIVIDCSKTTIEVLEDNEGFTKKKTSKVNGDTDSRHIPSNYNILIGGSDQSAIMDSSTGAIIYKGLVYTKPADDYNIIRNWGEDGSDYGTATMLLNRMISKNSKPKDKYYAEILSESLQPQQNFITQQKIYSILLFDYNLKSSVWKVTAYEVGETEFDYLQHEDTENYLEREGNTNLIEIE